ncbi:M10 family metallopeptidase C-terminal domain-containing protein [bacterium]|nr:M10 family metallopeptidase C-terminal domain-containing protein [bacterium]
MQDIQFFEFNKDKQARPLPQTKRQPIGLGLALTALTGCGGSDDASGNQVSGTYSFTTSEPIQTIDIDKNFKALEPALVQPYWTSSLIMSNVDQTVVPMLNSYSRIIEFSFPSLKPGYEQTEVLDWQPSTPQMKVAAREIFEMLGDYLDVTFVEVRDPFDKNVIALATSEQSASTGFAYFPNPHFDLGMDVFIANGYDAPRFVSTGITNYDYEVLMHEISHALGLKHPFEADGENTNVLSFLEDNSSHTVMSYNLVPWSFSGDLRALDLMSLTQLYGVNPAFNAGDDTYEFLNLTGRFIIDGGGIDSVIYQGSQNVFLDLRAGGHSYLGSKSAYITAGNQLTISTGSNIENAITGTGNDTIIGNGLNNLIETGDGDDRIFAGEGRDVISSGRGANTVDLSEEAQALDTLRYSIDLASPDFDVIYGFSQGYDGDRLDLTGLLPSAPDAIPLVDVVNVPQVRIDDAVVRVVGGRLDKSQDVKAALGGDGILSDLTLSEQVGSLIIAADTRETGEDQRLFAVYNHAEDLLVTQLAVFQGNYLDIDSWDIGNFSSAVIA